MFPDMDVGIYTSMTGDDEDFMFRYSIHQYLADKYMGLNPWLKEVIKNRKSKKEKQGTTFNINGGKGNCFNKYFNPIHLISLLFMK
jgi:hypothetical protein